MDQLRAAVAYVRSFFVSNWTLADYPVRVFQRTESQDLGRLRPFTWTAQVINWWHMRGDGYSQEEALESLRTSFENFRAANSLPRPGRGAELKVTFASSESLNHHLATAHELVESLFGIAASDCFMTDESTLWDFHDQDSNAEFLEAIRQRFGVDVANVEPPTIWAIAARLDEKRHGA